METFLFVIKGKAGGGERELVSEGEGKAPIKFCSAHAYEEAKVKSVWEME